MEGNVEERRTRCCEIDRQKEEREESSEQPPLCVTR